MVETKSIIKEFTEEVNIFKEMGLKNVTARENLYKSWTNSLL